MPNTTSPHILNTSANLLGFCLFVLTALNIADREETRAIDALTSVIALLLTVSCMFSFVSIRMVSPKRERLLENFADALFMLALIGILIVILLIALNYLG